MRALQLTKVYVLSGLRALVDRSVGTFVYTTTYIKTYTTHSPKFAFFLKSRYNNIESKGDENRETVNSAPRI